MASPRPLSQSITATSFACWLSHALAFLSSQLIFDLKGSGSNVAILSDSSRINRSTCWFAGGCQLLGTLHLLFLMLVLSLKTWSKSSLRFKFGKPCSKVCTEVFFLVGTNLPPLETWSCTKSGTCNISGGTKLCTPLKATLCNKRLKPVRSVCATTNLSKSISVQSLLAQ